MNCPQCTTVNPAGSRFCSNCGQPLLATASAPVGGATSGGAAAMTMPLPATQTQPRRRNRLLLGCGIAAGLATLVSLCLFLALGISLITSASGEPAAPEAPATRPAEPPPGPAPTGGQPGARPEAPGGAAPTTPTKPGQQPTGQTGLRLRIGKDMSPYGPVGVGAPITTKDPKIVQVIDWQEGMIPYGTQISYKWIENQKTVVLQKQFFVEKRLNENVAVVTAKQGFRAAQIEVQVFVNGALALRSGFTIQPATD